MSNTWKATLRLPKTSFPPKPKPGGWGSIQHSADELYRWQKQNLPREAPFVLHDGPPYANGSLHVGHALNKILKDMILRTIIQKGRRVEYVPGWDCHGLPIELKALEQLGAAHGATRALPAPTIRRAARALAERAADAQMAGFRSYGVMADWAARWRTMDPAFELGQLRLFQGLARGGLIYRRHKPVYWSPSSRSALAEAELEYRDDHASHAAYVRFPVARDEARWRALGLEGFDGRLFVLVWTTTPWTLPANKAVAVHDDMEYVVLQDRATGDSALIISADRLRSDGFLAAQDGFRILASGIKGSQLTGLTYVNKLQGKAAKPQPIIHASFVSNESGTGLVHLAPGHGQDDYEVCSALGIPAFAPIDDDGHFTAEAYPDDPEKLTSAGSILEQAGKAVVDLLGEDVVKTHRIRHKYPYDWRTKKPVVVRATSQWFADVGSIKAEALAALEDVKFIPDSGRRRLESFIQGRSEWCISRQRAWGVPIPALYDEKGEAVMTDQSIEHIIGVIQSRQSIEPWFSDDPEDPAWVAPSLGGKLRRGMDTMDVWFDSGSSWTQTPQRADLYLEGTDQHRGWFQSSLLLRVAAFRDQNAGRPAAEVVTSFAPFKALVTHGFTLDKDGKKMSKSLGNIVTPELVMHGTADARSKDAAWNASAWGPDVLRLWVASSDYTRDVAISTSVMQSVKSSLARYRITLKMLLGLLAREPAPDAPVTALDQVALLQLEDAAREVRRAHEACEFHRAVGAANHWLAADLSALYLEAAKDRLYCGDGGGDVPAALFLGLLRMLAPVTPLLVEEAWAHAPAWLRAREGPDAVAEPLYPLRIPWSTPLVDEAAFAIPRGRLRRDVPRLLALKAAAQRGLERARERKLVGSSLQSRVVIESCPVVIRDAFGPELADVLVVSEVGFDEPLPPGGEFHFAENVEGEEGIVVHVLPPRMGKCARCWRYLVPKEEAEASHDHDLCGRCVGEVAKLSESKQMRANL